MMYPEGSTLCLWICLIFIRTSEVVQMSGQIFVSDVKEPTYMTDHMRLDQHAETLEWHTVPDRVKLKPLNFPPWKTKILTTWEHWHYKSPSCRLQLWTIGARGSYNSLSTGGVSDWLELQCVSQAGVLLKWMPVRRIHSHWMGKRHTCSRAIFLSHHVHWESFTNHTLLPRSDSACVSVFIYAHAFE